MFRELDEVLDAATGRGFRHLGSLAAAAAEAVCDTREAAGQTFVRLKEDKATTLSPLSSAPQRQRLSTAHSSTNMTVGARTRHRTCMSLIRFFVVVPLGSRSCAFFRYHGTFRPVPRHPAAALPCLP